MLPELLARILAGRNVEVDAVDAFLDPTIKRSMPDPNVLTAMAEAAERIADAVVRGESIAIFGDYDVDGATSAALLARFLRYGGIEPIIHIPDRLFEGYGPNVEAVRALAARGATLLVTRRLRHHQHRAAGRGQHARRRRRRHRSSSGRRGAAAGRGHRQSEPARRSFRARSSRRGRARVHDRGGGEPGAARARLLDARTRPEPDLLALLDDVALGTVADVVPLIGLNRAFVAKGLIALRRRERAGHVSLMDVARLSGPPEAWHLGFLLGPRINAGGRIGRADLGVRLLLENDPIEAAKIAAELDRLNRERQAIEQETLAQAEAEAMAALGIEEKGAVVVTAAEGWHPGVVGLVAARLKEKFGRPAFAIALEPGGIGTGSGRSIAGVDIGRAVRRAVAEGLLVKGGGHAMAAGVTLRKGALAQLRAFLETTLGADVEAARRASGLLIDGAVSAAAADAELVAMIGRAGPFGSGNPEPMIALPAHTVTYAEEVGQAHMRARLKSADGGVRQCHRVPRRRPKARRRAPQQPRPASPCRRLIRARPLAGRGTRAVQAHRHRAGRAVCRAIAR